MKTDLPINGRDLSLRAAYVQFAKKCVPRAATLEQRRDLRRAFYMGAKAMYGLLMIAGTHQDDKESERQWLALGDECEKFRKGIGKPDENGEVVL